MWSLYRSQMPAHSGQSTSSSRKCNRKRFCMSASRSRDGSFASDEPDARWTQRDVVLRGTRGREREFSRAKASHRTPLTVGDLGASRSHRWQFVCESGSTATDTVQPTKRCVTEQSLLGEGNCREERRLPDGECLTRATNEDMLLWMWKWEDSAVHVQVEILCLRKRLNDRRFNCIRCRTKQPRK